jgi:hypothetical protein
VLLIGNDKYHTPFPLHTNLSLILEYYLADRTASPYPPPPAPTPKLLGLPTHTPTPKAILNPMPCPIHCKPQPMRYLLKTDFPSTW